MTPPIDPFEQKLVREYFKWGSVEEAICANDYKLPISYAHYQRILSKWGIIKKAGPNNKLSEAVSFFEHLTLDNYSVGDLYKKMPPSFQTSLSTLNRIYAYIKSGITRRVGCALVITQSTKPNNILIAKDISTPRIELGKKFGSITLPMGYSRKRDSRKGGILRILQNEVFTHKVIEQESIKHFIPEMPEPFMYLDIADVRVSVYHLELPKTVKLSDLSSFKLTEFQYVSIHEVVSGEMKNLRVGVKEIVVGYEKYLGLLKRNIKVNAFQVQSVLNETLIF